MSEQKNTLRLRGLWLLMGWLLVAFSIMVSLNSRGVPGISGIFNDKLIHMTGYAGLMLWFAQLYYSLRPRLVIAALLVAMGIALEFIQGLGGIRVFEVADMIANTAGVAVGGLLALTGLDSMLIWFERRLLSRVKTG